MCIRDSRKAKRGAKTKKSIADSHEDSAAFVKACIEAGLPEPNYGDSELWFGKEKFGRNWRADFFFEHNGKCVAVEKEGGIHTGKSRHTTGTGYEQDMQKYNAYVLLGIPKISFTPAQMKTYTKQCIVLIGYMLGLHTEAAMLVAFAETFKPFKAKKNARPKASVRTKIK